MKTYHDMDTDIELIVGELKVRRKMDDSDVGKLIGLTAGSVRNYRCNGTFPNMAYCKVAELARAAGYEIKFERREE